MMGRIVEEDIEAPNGALGIYAPVVLLGALLIRVLTHSSGFFESMCLCGLAPVLVVYCYYHVRSENEHLRRRFRIYLSALTAIACAILLSHGGLRVRALDPVNALVFGVCSGVTTHLIGLIVGAVADLFLDRVRQFVNPQECRTCAYDLTGNTSGICPECGTSVPLHQRGHMPTTSKGSVTE